MTSTEVELQILLSEKDHSDRLVSGYSELQLKLLAFLFAAASATAGLVFATGERVLGPRETAIAILVASVVGCAVLLQSVVTYGLTLGHIHYKKHVLGPRLAQLASRTTSPLQAVEAFATSGAQLPVFIAAAALVGAHLCVTATLLLYAATLASRSAPMVAAFGGAWLLLALTAFAEALLGRAMRTVGKAPAPVPSVPASVGA